MELIESDERYIYQCCRFAIKIENGEAIIEEAELGCA